MELAGKNVLVTGGTGFIGSHLVKRLILEKANIVVPYQSLNTKSYFYSEGLNKQVILAQKDLKNFKRTIDIVTKYEIEFIFHLAAQSIVPTAYHNPLETFETNIMGTANILEAARLYGKVQGIIVVSSDKAYGKIPKANENDALSGDHPYETSKAAADLLAHTYFRTYHLPVAITRFGNVYGEGDFHFGRIIPDICQAVIKNKPLKIRSDGTYVRDYLHVKDVVSGYLFLLENLKKVLGEAFNFSSTDNLSVLELVRRIEKILGVPIPYKIKNTAQNEIPYQHLNDQKVRKLGWKPRYNLENTLTQILNWYEKIM